VSKNAIRGAPYPYVIHHTFLSFILQCARRQVSSLGRGLDHLYVCRSYTILPNRCPSLDLQCKMISSRFEDLPAFTASCSTPLPPTLFPFFGLGTTTVNFSCNGMTVVFPSHSTSLALFSWSTDFCFHIFLTFLNMCGTTVDACNHPFRPLLLLTQVLSKDY